MSPLETILTAANVALGAAWITTSITAHRRSRKLRAALTAHQDALITKSAHLARAQLELSRHEEKQRGSTNPWLKPRVPRARPLTEIPKPAATVDSLAAGLLGASLYTGSGSYDGSTYTPSCDTTSSSSDSGSSSDGGSCGGGE